MKSRLIFTVAGYWLPGLILLGAAFWAGAQKDPTMGMLGFVPFFMAASFLFIYGWKRRNGPEENKPHEGDS